MTGLERNSDVVEMASYAPLLANSDYVDWTPDAIWFDNERAYGSAELPRPAAVRPERGRARGADAPSRRASAPDPSDIRGARRARRLDHAGRYDDVRVTAEDGSTLFADDFSEGAGSGRQRAGQLDHRRAASTPGRRRSTDARTTAGAAELVQLHAGGHRPEDSGDEGFLIMFGVP